MIQQFPNSIKATLMQKLKSYNTKFLANGQQLNYKISDDDPLNDTFNVEITPDDLAQKIFPLLDKYKPQVQSPEQDSEIRQTIKELLIKEAFNLV